MADISIVRKEVINFLRKILEIRENIRVEVHKVIKTEGGWEAIAALVDFGFVKEKYNIVLNDNLEVQSYERIE